MSKEITSVIDSATDKLQKALDGDDMDSAQRLAAVIVNLTQGQANLAAASAASG